MYIDLVTINLCPGQGGGGVKPSGTLDIVENGVYNVYSYSSASVDVPQSVTGFTEKEITEQSFTIINLSNSASYVANQVFKDKKDLQTVYLPNCTEVRSSAFQNCTSLSSIYLPNCVSIGNYAFQSTGITSVNLPYTTSVGNFAFYRCYSLTQVSLPMCSYIEDNVFYNCRLLNQINLPVCSYIGNSVFFNCFSLSQASLPLCEYIGSGAFRTCSLLSLSLPVCSYIGGLAFYGCSSLSIITIGYSGICSLGDARTFETTQITSSTGSIYVPTSLVDSYKSANYWSQYSNRIFPIE